MINRLTVFVVNTGMWDFFCFFLPILITSRYYSLTTYVLIFMGSYNRVWCFRFLLRCCAMASLISVSFIELCARLYRFNIYLVSRIASEPPLCIILFLYRPMWVFYLSTRLFSSKLITHSLHQLVPCDAKCPTKPERWHWRYQRHNDVDTN